MGAKFTLVIADKEGNITEREFTTSLNYRSAEIALEEMTKTLSRLGYDATGSGFIMVGEVESNGEKEA